MQSTQCCALTQLLILYLYLHQAVSKGGFYWNSEACLLFSVALKHLFFVKLHITAQSIHKHRRNTIIVLHLPHNLDDLQSISKSFGDLWSEVAEVKGSGLQQTV